MEELVTVDEVGEDDDSIIEPDLPELERFVSCPKGTTEGEAAEEKEEEQEEEEISPPRRCVELQKTPAEMSIQDRLSSEVDDPAEVAGTMKPEPVSSESGLAIPTLQGPQQSVAPEPALIVIGDIPTEELKAKLEETCLEDKATSDEAPEESPQKHTAVPEEAECIEAGPVTETVRMEVRPGRESLKKGSK